MLVSRITRAGQLHRLSAATLALARMPNASHCLPRRVLSMAASQHGLQSSDIQQGYRAQAHSSNPATRRAQDCTMRSVASKPAGVEVEWADGEVSTFHYEWLHRNRPETKLACGQNTAPPSLSLPPLTASHSSARILNDGGSEALRLTWGETSDVSIFPSEWLRHYAYSAPSMAARDAARRAVPTSSIHSVQYSDIMSSESSVADWLTAVNRDGVCLVRGVPAELDMVGSVAGRIGGVMPTIYGQFWDVKTVANPINCAYTNHALDLHQDLAYYESPPGIQLLHCVRFDEGIKGGDSTFVDSFLVAERLRTEDPEAFEVLSRVPATFQKIHYDRPEPVHLEYRRPHIEVNHTGKVINVFWSPAFEGPLEAPESDVPDYYRAYRKFAEMVDEHALRVRLQPGDLVCFSNRRMLHGRTAFAEAAGSVRHLQGCYVAMETFINRLRVLQNSEGDGPKRLSGVQAARCCNGDFS